MCPQLHEAYLIYRFFSFFGSLISPHLYTMKATDSVGYRLAIFASGAGSNAGKIIEYFRAHATIVVGAIICNKEGAGVINIARQNNIPVVLIERNRFFKEDAYVDELQTLNIDFIVLAGFLWKIPQGLIDVYRNRIINIHPALLPKFGGKGMYGNWVHQAVIDAGEKESGITIHYVDEHYDNGDIIFQANCSVEEGDTADTLAAKIHALEHAHFAPVIEQCVINNL